MSNLASPVDREADESPPFWVDDSHGLQEEFSELFDEVLDGEALASLQRRLAKNGVPSAICLSGGGIRSATFCLGVLQTLASANWLSRFHYLSTVSGGGFIGSWLSRWRRCQNEPGTDPQHYWKQDQMVEPEDSNAGPNDPVHPVRRLRSFSNYLSPTWGISPDGLTLFSGFLLRFMLNLLLWAMIFLSTALIVRFFVLAVQRVFHIGDPGVAAILTALALPILWITVFALLFVIALLRLPGQPQWTRLSGSMLGFALRIFALVALFAVIPEALASYFADHGDKALPIAIATLILGGTSAAGFWSRLGPGMKEAAAKFLEKVQARFLLVLSAATLVIFCVAAGLAGHYFIEAVVPFPNWGLGCVAANVVEYYDPRIRTSPPLCRDLGWLRAGWAIGIGLGLFALAAVYSAFAGANRSSLHSLYGNRLIRAYLGSGRWTRTPLGNSDFDPNDDVEMASLAQTRGCPSLFHVVNMTLNLARSGGHRSDWQERRGASFTATALRVGSRSLGFVKASSYAAEAKSREGITLGRAITISGAAASPNMGYYSHALTAVAMTILNIRLGWWLPNPARAKPGSDPKLGWISNLFLLGKAGNGDGAERKAAKVRALLKRSEPHLGMVHVVSEALSNLDEDSDWVYLSDGGHFENLGLYEMVRRKCMQILVVDAGCDGKLEYADLHNAVRKIQVDFGIPIELPATLVGQAGPGEACRLMTGRIRYSAIDPARSPRDDGWLYILKPVINGSEPAHLQSYVRTSRAGSNQFPHHSTGDQFFDETQFESYRMLGAFSAARMIEALEKNSFAKRPTKSPSHFPEIARAAASPAAQSQSSGNPTSAAAEPAAHQAKAAGQTNGWAGEALGTLQEMSGTQLFARLLGIVAAVTITAGVAGKVGDGASDEAADAARKVWIWLTGPELPSGEPATPPEEKDDKTEVENVVTDDETEGDPATEQAGAVVSPPDKEVSDLKNRLDALEAELSALKVFRTATTDTLGKIGTEIDKLRGRIDQMNFANLESRIAALEREMGALTRRHDQLNSRVRALAPERNVSGN